MRVNMDSSIATDPRFVKIGRRLGVTRREVYGTCFLVWLVAYERRTDTLGREDVDIAAELDGFADAMVEFGLATDSGDDTVTLHGVTERINFLTAQAKRGKRGGKSSAASRRATTAQASGQANAQANASGTAQTYTPAPALTPALDLTPDPYSPAAHTARARVEPGARGDAADRLWLLQEDLRCAVGYPESMRRGPQPHELMRIVELLRTRTEAQLEHCQRVLQREALEDPKRRDWLDRHRNWHPNVIDPCRDRLAEQAPRYLAPAVEADGLALPELTGRWVEFLNAEAGTQYVADDALVRLVGERVREGHDRKALHLVAWHRSALWRSDPKMREHLRPSTLLSPEKFGEYLSQARQAEQEAS